jgi:hypothetical protein
MTDVQAPPGPSRFDCLLDDSGRKRTRAALIDNGTKVRERAAVPKPVDPEGENGTPSKKGIRGIVIHDSGQVGSTGIVRYRVAGGVRAERSRISTFASVASIHHSIERRLKVFVDRDRNGVDEDGAG